MSPPDVVLDIPIPQRVQALPRTPPVCLPSKGDVAVIELLKNFGHKLGINENEIYHACNLAAGFSDVVIILERPHQFNYTASFEKLVQDCPSLRSVDELIRFASNGARSIHTVTVLDAFSYQPNKQSTKFDKRCHQLLADMLRVKKPQVIICCHTSRYQNEWMRRLELPTTGYELVRHEVDFDDSSCKAALFQSFHPSCAVNYAQRVRPEYRALLIHHFVTAFAELHTPSQLPECAEPIRRICLDKAKPKDTNLEMWQAASCICHWFEEEYCGKYTSWAVEFADDTPRKRLSRRMCRFDKMYSCLQRLAEKPCSLGALAIAKIKLLWRRYFQDDPLYEQVTSLLHRRGCEQLEWFSSSVDSVAPTDPLTIDFLELHITSPLHTLHNFNGDAA